MRKKNVSQKKIVSVKEESRYEEGKKNTTIDGKCAYPLKYHFLDIIL